MTEYAAWIGQREMREERIAPFPADALAATLGRSDPHYGDGAALPPLWHWLYFLPVYPLSDAGYDGHASLGGFLPPVSLPRRMWAGGRLDFHAPMRIGRVLRKVSTVKSVTPKEGRSGMLVFVTVAHEIFDEGALCLTEEHDIVYREALRAGAAPPEPPDAPETSAFSREIAPGPVMLFRYSALTFNGHRIHYDQPFATGSEGYAGLVVHGPLIATLLLDLLHRERSGASVARFEFRSTATICDTAPFSVHGAQNEDGTVRLWARRHDGALAMDATAHLARGKDDFGHSRRAIEMLAFRNLRS